MLQLNRDKIIDQKFIWNDADNRDEVVKEVNQLLSEGYVIDNIRCSGGGAGSNYSTYIENMVAIYLVKYENKQYV